MAGESSNPDGVENPAPSKMVGSAAATPGEMAAVVIFVEELASEGM